MTWSAPRNTVYLDKRHNFAEALQSSFLSVDAARRRAAARKMKQMKSASKDTDDLDNEDDIDDVYSDFNGTYARAQLFHTRQLF